jgi:citrate/tricarballylate utilization protein
VAGVVLFLLALGAFTNGSAFTSAHPDGEGAFHALLPHAAMAWTFGAAFVAAIAALVAGSVRFWRDIGEEPGTFLTAGPFGQSVDDALRLKYLDGGGDGCTYPGEIPSGARKWFHHLTFYGFMLCFAATCVATLYHYVLGRHAPYPISSLPVILGTLGGIGLLIGPAGLLWLKRRRDPALASEGQTGMDAAFIVLLFVVSLTGLLLLALRETPAMGVLLAAHLGTVMGLFLTMPYGKFVHGIYRFTALVRYHVERRRPVPELGSE